MIREISRVQSNMSTNGKTEAHLVGSNKAFTVINAFQEANWIDEAKGYNAGEDKWSVKKNYTEKGERFLILM